MTGFRQGLLIATAASALSNPAFAQDVATGATAVEDIIVTGTKTSAGEAAQDVPASVFVLGGGTIEKQGIRDLTELGYRIPNIRLQPTGLNPGHASYSIRGIGTNSSTPSDEPVVVTVLDGMVLGTSLGAAFQTFDVEAVEAYRGPQGVLFGKNSTGGVVNARSRRPSGSSHLTLRAVLGSYDRYGAAIAAEAPIVADLLAARVAATYEHQGGYFRDGNFPGRRIGGGSETWTIRPSLRFTPTDRLDIDIIAEFFDYEGDGGVFRNLSSATIATSLFGVPACVGRSICRNQRSSGTQDSQHVIGEVNYDLGFGKLTSITAYRQLSLANRNVDADATTAPIFNFEYLLFDQHQFSEEVRLAGTAFSDNFSYVAGIYYFDQKWGAREGRRLQTSPAGAPRIVRGKSDLDNSQTAAFGQFTYKLLPELSVVLGGRYTHETKQMTLSPLVANNCSAPTTCSITFSGLKFKSNNFSPKIGVEWQVEQDILAYSSFARGFRAGGYNSRYSFTTRPSPYQDEKVDAYEIGIKSDWLDRALRVNLALFHNRFGDLQRTILKPDSTQDVVNAAAVVIEGAELETSIVPLRGLRFDFSAGYTDARYKSFNDPRLTATQVKTLKLERAPKWNLNAGASYEFDLADWGRVSTAVNYSYTGKYIASTLNELGFYVPSLHLVDATVGLEVNRHFKVSLFGKNLADEIYGPITAVVMPLLLTQTVAPPRTFGVQLDYNF